MKQRNSNGTYKFIPFKNSQFGGLKMGLVIVGLGAILWKGTDLYTWLHTFPDPISPLGPTIVHAQDVVMTITTPVVKTEKEQIQDYIRSKFGNDAEKMITIIGTCENGTWDQKRTNKNRNGSVDYGIMQTNSSNDKLCRGLDYKNSWKHNIDCGYRIYQSQGISAWACSSVVGETPFYMKRSK